MKVLIFGRSGSGKTTLAMYLMRLLDKPIWFNADMCRKQYNDWDFSYEGRERQAYRMKDLMDKADEDGFNVIVDFVCPFDIHRGLFGSDVYKVWVDTVNRPKGIDTFKLKVYKVADIYDADRKLVAPGLETFDNHPPESQFILKSDEDIFLIDTTGERPSRIKLDRWSEDMAKQSGYANTKGINYIVKERRGDVDARLIVEELYER